MDPRVKRIADEARRRAHEANARGDYEAAKRFDAMERQALRQDEGGDQPAIGHDLRTI